jgi:predicted DNA-binding transcriptional regulator AlpA
MASTTVTVAHEERFLDADEVAARLGITSRALRTWVNLGAFPAPLRRGRKWVRWLLADVEALLEQLRAARSGRQPQPAA